MEFSFSHVRKFLHDRMIFCNPFGVLTYPSEQIETINFKKKLKKLISVHLFGYIKSVLYSAEMLLLFKSGFFIFMRYVGIDISKDTFHVYNPILGAKHFDNHASGFRAFKKWTGEPVHAVMEASGVYGLRLAHRLSKWKFGVSVVNPLKVHRFNQMRLSRTKTDKQDAASIHDFAVMTMPAKWTPPPAHLSRLKQILAAIELLKKQKVSSSNVLKMLQFYPKTDRRTVQSIQQIVLFQKDQIIVLEDEVDRLIKKHYSNAYKSLISIPGVGPKSASILIATTDAFQIFQNSKQLVAFAGIAPRIIESGTTIKKKVSIARYGNPLLRKCLFMCILNAIRLNPTYKVIFDRMKKAGKPGKIVLIALCNKLLGQCYAIVKQQSVYDQNYLAVLSKAKEVK